MKITSPAHAMAIGLYLMMALLGAIWALDLAPTGKLDVLLGVGWQRILGVGSVAAGIAGAAAAFGARFFKRPDSIMVTELVACVILSGIFGTYLAAIMGGGAITTQVLTAGMVVAPLARVGQIWVELRRINA